MVKLLDLDVNERAEASLACAIWVANHGAAILRVHEVRPTVRAMRMTEALRNRRR
jgi:dihydropteroate synthase